MGSSDRGILPAGGGVDVSQANKLRPWVRSLLVFVGCCLVNVFFCCIWNVILLAELGTPPGGVKASDIWFWIFMFPARAMKDMNWEAANVLLFLNPFIYGGMWWFAWRMWRLMRRKSESDG